MSTQYISADLGEPILFRTTGTDVYDATLTTGSLWLRSDRYYTQIEDEARRDQSEGINVGKLTAPLRIQPKNGVEIVFRGEGQVGQQIVPHYIVSLHGSSIFHEQLRLFGGYTFGIKSISKLAAEILYQSSKMLKCVGYRYGQVFYQYASLAQSNIQTGGSAICIGGEPPIYINPLNTDVLRKQPVKPFIEQDEWRIVIFTDGYLEDDAIAPLRINVDVSHFYAYQRADEDS